MVASSAVDSGFKSQLGQSKDFKIVSDLRRVSGFLQVLQISSTKRTAILWKVGLTPKF
jgi:hypothetical protein